APPPRPRKHNRHHAARRARAPRRVSAATAAGTGAARRQRSATWSHQLSRPLELVIDAGPGIRNLTHAHAGGVVDRVPNGGARVEHRVLAETLGPERISLNRGFHENRDELGQVENRGRPVLVQRLRYGNARWGFD